MSLRHGMVLSVGLVLAAAPVLGETLPLPPRLPAAGTTAGAPVRLAQAQVISWHTCPLEGRDVTDCLKADIIAAAESGSSAHSRIWNPVG